jgi:hypothetical protein
VKPSSAFYRDVSRSNGLTSRCTACVREAARREREAGRLERIRMGEEVLQEAGGGMLTVEQERLASAASAARGEQKRQAARTVEIRMSAEERAEHDAARRRHFAELNARCTPEILARNLAEAADCWRHTVAEFGLRQRAAREGDPEKAEELHRLALTHRAAWQALEQLWFDRKHAHYPDLNFATHLSAS